MQILSWVDGYSTNITDSFYKKTDIQVFNLDSLEGLGTLFCFLIPMRLVVMIGLYEYVWLGDFGRKGLEKISHLIY